MLKKIKQVKLYEDVALQIEEAIIAGDFKPGDKLPPERELEEILGASRGTIRLSLRILEQNGLLEIRTGTQGGAFVREITPELITKSITSLIRFNYVSLDHIAHFRENIEGTLIARLAVVNAEPDDVRELKAMLDRLIEISQKEDMDWPAFDSLEHQMHVFLGRMTKNPLFEALSATIMQSISNFASYIDRTKTVMKEVINDWEEIIGSLENKGAEETTQLIRTHILKWSEKQKAGIDKLEQ
jgi:DNA-binding FadR family transcriptional regulator